MNKRRHFFVILACLLAGCQTVPDAGERQATLQQVVSQHGRIVRLADGQTITSATLLGELSQAEMLVVGEQHDQIRHHQIEEWLVRELPALRPAGSYVLEMATVAQQDGINAAQRDFASARPTPDLLQKQLQWSPGWPWPLYGDLVTTLMEQRQPVLAANLDKPEVSQLMQSAKRPEGQETSQPEVAQTLANYITNSHATNATLDGMVAVQMQRDRRMAQTLLNAPKPAVLFAGNIHALKDVGVPMHLRDLKPEAVFPSVKVLLLVNDGTDADTTHADYLWVTQ